MTNDVDCLHGYVGGLYIFFCEISVHGFPLILSSRVDLCLSLDQ